MVTSILVLVFSNTATPFCIEVNSFDYATGTVFSQELKIDGK